MQVPFDEQGFDAADFGLPCMPLLDAWMPLLLADPPQAAVVSQFLPSLIAPPSLLLLLMLPFRMLRRLTVC